MASDDPFDQNDDPLADAAAPIEEEAAAPEDAAVPEDAAAPGAQPQQPGPLQPQPRTQKPRSNVYTMMLILSFAAMVTSCVLLYLHLQQYGDYPWWEVPSDIAAEVGN